MMLHMFKKAVKAKDTVNSKCNKIAKQNAIQNYLCQIVRHCRFLKKPIMQVLKAVVNKEQQGCHNYNLTWLNDYLGKDKTKGRKTLKWKMEKKRKKRKGTK